MTHPDVQSSSANDSEESIFLPITENPEREFDNWRLALLMGRGEAEGKSVKEILRLSELLEEARDRHLGGLGIKAV